MWVSAKHYGSDLEHVMWWSIQELMQSISWFSVVLMVISTDVYAREDAAAVHFGEVSSGSAPSTNFLLMSVIVCIIIVPWGRPCLIFIECKLSTTLWTSSSMIGLDYPAPWFHLITSSCIVGWWYSSSLLDTCAATHFPFHGSAAIQFLGLWRWSSWLTPWFVSSMICLGCSASACSPPSFSSSSNTTSFSFAQSLCCSSSSSSVGSSMIVPSVVFHLACFQYGLQPIKQLLFCLCWYWFVILGFQVFDDVWLCWAWSLAQCRNCIFQ